MGVVVVVVLFSGLIALAGVTHFLEHSTDDIPTSAPAGITLINFEQLSKGMSYSDVVEIFGSVATEYSTGDVTSESKVVYTWQHRGAESNVNIVFLNEKLVSKAQFGLQ